MNDRDILRLFALLLACSTPVMNTDDDQSTRHKRVICCFLLWIYRAVIISNLLVLTCMPVCFFFVFANVGLLLQQEFWNFVREIRTEGKGRVYEKQKKNKKREIRLTCQVEMHLNLDLERQREHHRDLGNKNRRTECERRWRSERE